MKQLLVGLCLFLTLPIVAQDKRDFVFNASRSESIVIDVSFPNIVLKTWDKNEVKIQASININDGRNNDRFKLTSEQDGAQLLITSEITGIDDWNNHTIYGNRSEDSKDKIRISKNGKTITIGDNDDYSISEEGNEIDVELEIYVPVHKPLTIKAKFGMVEVLEVPDDLEVYAKFGGADLSIDESALGFLKASSSWGQIFSNLSEKMEFEGNDMLGKQMIAKLEKGKGKKLSVKSDFGNVYLRKN